MITKKIVFRFCFCNQPDDGYMYILAETGRWFPWEINRCIRLNILSF